MRRGRGSPNFLHPLPVLFPLHTFLKTPATHLYLGANQGKKTVRKAVAKVKFEKILTKKIYYNLNFVQISLFFICFYAQPGRLSECQGMGWYLEEANLAQVSLNLLDYHQAGMHTAFEECVKDAKVLLFVRVP